MEESRQALNPCKNPESRCSNNLVANVNETPNSLVAFVTCFLFLVIVRVRLNVPIVVNTDRSWVFQVPQGSSKRDLRQR